MSTSTVGTDPPPTSYLTADVPGARVPDTARISTTSRLWQRHCLLANGLKMVLLRHYCDKMEYNSVVTMVANCHGVESISSVQSLWKAVSKVVDVPSHS